MLSPTGQCLFWQRTHVAHILCLTHKRAPRPTGPHTYPEHDICSSIRTGVALWPLPSAGCFLDHPQDFRRLHVDHLRDATLHDQEMGVVFGPRVCFCPRGQNHAQIISPIPGFPRIAGNWKMNWGIPFFSMLPRVQFFKKIETMEFRFLLSTSRRPKI